jgi:RNA polymerase sigma-70 factor (ECF subfamily)
LDEVTTAPAPAAQARFDEVFRSHYRQLHGLLFRLIGDRQEAEDVLQEVFIKLAGSDVLRKPDDEVRAWLRRVCLNTGHNRLRAGRRAEHHINRAGQLAVAGDSTGSPGPLDGVLLKEQQDAVRRALDTLPRNQRDCLLLRHSGYSYAEIAATLEISAGSVGVFLARGEHAFRISYETQEQDR